jgi:hypothetical protein
VAQNGAAEDAEPDPPDVEERKKPVDELREQYRLQLENTIREWRETRAAVVFRNLMEPILLSLTEQEELVLILFEYAREAAPVCSADFADAYHSDRFRKDKWLQVTIFATGVCSLWEETTKNVRFENRGVLPFGWECSECDLASDLALGTGDASYRKTLNEAIERKMGAQFDRYFTGEPGAVSVFRGISGLQPIPRHQPPAPTPGPMAQNGVVEDGTADPFPTPELRTAVMARAMGRGSMKELALRWGLGKHGDKQLYKYRQYGRRAFSKQEKSKRAERIEKLLKEAERARSVPETHAKLSAP